MTTNELVKNIFLRIGRYKFIIILGGVVLAALLYFYAKQSHTVYTSRASVFPLTSSSDNSTANSTLSSILGISDAPKSFSQEASINIVELALSRNTREAVALTPMPQFANRTIAELLIDNFNKTKSFFGESIKMPTDNTKLAAIGGGLLKSGIFAKINKNGILEINFSCTSEELVGPISYVFIDKISEFYKELKIKKARIDYDFTISKIDSLDHVLAGYDKKAIHMANTTLFVPSDKIEFNIPKENLVGEKDRVQRQRDASANNREEALWRLQKVTPIIATLDKPDPPYEVQKTSGVLYASLGFFIGCLLTAVIMVAGLLYNYAKWEMNKAIFGPAHVANN